MTRAELLALAERVEKGEIADDINETVAPLCGWRRDPTWGGSGGWYRGGFTKVVDGEQWFTPLCVEHVPNYCLSMDAQAALPRLVWHMQCVKGRDNEVVRWEAYAGGIAAGVAPTEPAARLTALLRAMAEGV